MAGKFPFPPKNAKAPKPAKADKMGDGEMMDDKKPSKPNFLFAKKDKNMPPKKNKMDGKMMKNKMNFLAKAKE